MCTIWEGAKTNLDAHRFQIVMPANCPYDFIRQHKQVC